MQVDAGLPRLDLAREVEVGGAGKVGVDAALHADLGRPDVPRLLDAVADLLHGEGEGVRVGAPLGECAEPAARVADVGEVDVAVDDIADPVADGVVPHAVGEAGQGVEVAALGVQECEVFGVRESRGGSVSALSSAARTAGSPT